MKKPDGYIGHPRDRVRGLCVADPMLRYGHFRVLPQTTGGFVVIDETRPMGDQAITKPSLLEAADAKARWFHQNDRRPSVRAELEAAE